MDLIRACYQIRPDRVRRTGPVNETGEWRPRRVCRVFCNRGNLKPGIHQDGEGDRYRNPVSPEKDEAARIGS